MKDVLKLSISGVVAGIVLMSILKIVQLIAGSDAYVLLFNTDYIPLLPDWGPEDIGGVAFHFIFCIVSVVALFFILGPLQLEKSILPYFLIYTIGSAVLYSLTGLTEREPTIDDPFSWAYWTSAHAVYAYAVGWLIKHWL